MNRKVAVLALAAVMTLAAAVPLVHAGIEPSPWMPEMNKLNSIELNLGAVQKRLENRVSEPVLPEGTQNYLEAIANQTGVLNLRLWDVLAALPPYGSLGPDQEEVGLALDGIRTSAVGAIGLLEQFGRRMGVEPTPWKASLQAMIVQINNYVGTIPTLTADPPK